MNTGEEQIDTTTPMQQESQVCLLFFFDLDKKDFGTMGNPDEFQIKTEVKDEVKDEIKEETQLDKVQN